MEAKDIPYNICGIYKIISPSGRVYIGQSIDIKKRWTSYRFKSLANQHKLKNSFNKYGVDRHIFSIIHQCDKCDLDKLEKYYVDLFQSFNSRYGLNIRDGGGARGVHSEDTKKKMSLSAMGRKHTDVAKAKMVAWRTGRKLSDATKQKMSNSHKGIHKGYKHTKESREKMSAGMKGRVANNRKITLQYNLSNKLIGVYCSLTDAAIKNNLSIKAINNCLCGINKTSGGFIWRYQ